MKKFGKDPGLGSGILLSALTDVFGFLSFLGIATVLLHLFGAAL
jgi:magnesium transporter